MKKHNVLKVILLSILVVVLCTWIFPTASYQSGLEIGERNQAGIFDLFAYITPLLNYFSYVLLVVLATGIFYGVSYKIPAYRGLLDKIVKKFEGKESLFLAITMILIAIIVSVSGFSFGILFIYPLIISLILLMGYNKLVAASVTVGSTMIGILGTTLGTNTTYYIGAILGIDTFSEIQTKIVLLILGLILLVYNVLLYAKKTKNKVDKVSELVPISSQSAKKETEVITIEKVEDKQEKKPVKKKEEKKKTPKKEEKESKKTTKKTTDEKKSKKTKAYDLVEEEVVKVKPKQKKKIFTWPYIFIFDVLFLILVLSMFDWSIFGIDWFDKALTAINDFQIAGFPIFEKLLASNSALKALNPLGQWSLSFEIPTMIVIATCLLAFVYGLKMDDFLDGVISGIKKALKPAIYMTLMNLVLLIVTWHPFQLNITKFFLELTDGFNVITMAIVAALASILNMDIFYVAQSTLPYVTSVITDSELYPILGVIFQSVYGLTMLIAPTSLLLIGTLTYLDVSYGQWLKHIWKLFLQLLVVLTIVLLIIFLI